MAEFKDIIKGRGCMCQKYFTEHNVHKCPLHKQTLAGCGDCAAWIITHPYEAENIIANWISSNKKVETLMDEAMKMYNNKLALRETGVPEACPGMINPDWGGNELGLKLGAVCVMPDEVCRSMKTCEECWKRPLPKE